MSTYIATTVVDIITRSRQVRVPKVCPKCRAELDKPGALKIWEFQDQSRSAEFSEDFTINDALGDLPDCGESFIGPVEISCVECGLSLASNREAHLGVEAAKHPHIQQLLNPSRKKRKKT